MNKNFAFLIITLVLVSYVSAADIAYLVKNPAKLNTNFIDSINELGYSYDVISDSAIPTTNFANYKMILVGDEPFTNYASIPVGTKKTLTLNTYYLDDFKISRSVGSTTSDSYGYGNIALNNSITEGITNPIQFYIQKKIPLYYPTFPRAGGFVSLVYRSGSTTDSIVGYIEKGGALYGGGTADERLVFIGASEANSWSEPSKQLFKNSINWILRDLCTDLDGDYYIKENSDVSSCEQVCGPTHSEDCFGNNDCNDNSTSTWQIFSGYVDKDGDGLGIGSELQVCSGEQRLENYSDDGGDCNDNDVNSWELVQGYVDNDSDGLGIGNLTEVCSDGESLPIGYTDNNHDCNDSDSNLWQLMPGYVDNDSDGLGIGELIQVCSGEVLLENYSDINGDCNDNDSNLWQLMQGYVDNDSDGLGIGNLTEVCSGETLPIKYSDINGDCNDNDADLWQVLQGYVDSDLDGFGIGELSDVCSGINLSIGYSDINGDCNDNNLEINPDLNEIAYNGLDDSCQGYDLADIDSDGYCNAGYLIQNASLQCEKEQGLVGTDCNDDDSSMNPSATDLSKNCINDAPSINPIGKRVVFEGDIVIITASVIDPEEDSLTYSINDSRFVQEDNVFKWETVEGDKGTYFVRIEASDGDLSDFIIVQVDVRKTNKAPVCTDIPLLEWDEAGNASINLTNYCSDEENDPIYYLFEEGSSGDLISLDSLEDGIAVFNSPDYWYGEGWIVFKVSDGRNNTLTNQIGLKVNHINKMPVLTANIPDVNWDQDSNLTNAINLGDYFSDPDSNLSFSFNENEFIGIVIEDGIVSFYPISDWIGNEKVIFNATDGEYSVSSNEINLNVLLVNKAPIFENLDCNIALLEDNIYHCQLNASDPENDSLSYTVPSKTNLDCSIEGDNLRYVGFNDYFGPASCLLRVTDTNGRYNDLLFEVNIENIDDPIYLTDYSPRIDPRLLIGSTQMFRIEVSDLDSSVMINWTVNGESVAYGTSYLFQAQTAGTYNVTATATDGENGTFVGWDVFVGNLNQFKCSEVSGDTCSEAQECSESFLGVYDTNRCCPVTCSSMPHQFKALKNISQNKSENIHLRIIDPAESQLFKVGDSLKTRIEILNNLGSKSKFETEIYLYDITKDKIIEREKKSVTIESGRSKAVEVYFDIKEDIKDSNDYVIITRAIGRDQDNNEYYNQNYTNLRIERRDNEVVIKDFKLSPEEGICGDLIYATVEVQNIGKTNEDVIIKLENSALNIEQSYSTYLEEYEESDKISKEFKVNIPNSAIAGNYSITAKILFANGKVETMQKTLTLGECQTENIETSPLETIKIESETKPAEGEITNNKLILFGVMSALTLTLFIFVVIILIIYNRKNMRFKENISTDSKINEKEKKTAKKIKK